jgi:hypothetical protein
MLGTQVGRIDEIVLHESTHLEGVKSPLVRVPARGGRPTAGEIADAQFPNRIHLVRATREREKEGKRE